MDVGKTKRYGKLSEKMRGGRSSIEIVIVIVLHNMIITIIIRARHKRTRQYLNTQGMVGFRGVQGKYDEANEITDRCNRVWKC